MTSSRQVSEPARVVSISLIRLEYHYSRILTSVIKRQDLKRYYSRLIRH